MIFMGPSLFSTSIGTWNGQTSLRRLHHPGIPRSLQVLARRLEFSEIRYFHKENVMAKP